MKNCSSACVHFKSYFCFRFFQKNKMAQQSQAGMKRNFKKNKQNYVIEKLKKATKWWENKLDAWNRSLLGPGSRDYSELIHKRFSKVELLPWQPISFAKWKSLAVSLACCPKSCQFPHWLDEWSSPQSENEIISWFFIEIVPRIRSGNSKVNKALWNLKTHRKASQNFQKLISGIGAGNNALTSRVPEAPSNGQLAEITAHFLSHAGQSLNPGVSNCRHIHRRNRIGVISSRSSCSVIDPDRRLGNSGDRSWLVYQLSRLGRGKHDSVNIFGAFVIFDWQLFK